MLTSVDLLIESRHVERNSGISIVGLLLDHGLNGSYAGPEVALWEASADFLEPRLWTGWTEPGQRVNQW